MQQSFNRSEWKENWSEEASRLGLTGHDSPEILRKYFPYRGKVVCAATPTGVIYGVKPGEEIEYVRTKLEPQMFPLEAVIVQEDKSLRRMSFKSVELQVMEV